MRTSNIAADEKHQKPEQDVHKLAAKSKEEMPPPIKCNKNL